MRLEEDGNECDEEELRKRSADVVWCAQQILAGSIGTIEGARALARLRFEVCDDELDPDFLLLVGIDSETDHLPLGAVRDYWAKDALAAKDLEIEEAEAFYRESALVACRRLVERFGQNA